MSAQPDLFIDKSAAALDEEARKVKRTKDYMAEVTELIPKTLETFRADKTKFQDAINTLLPLEKKARLASDAPSTSATAKAILQICAEAKKWSVLSDQLTYLVKSRAQLIAVMKAAVAYTLEIVQTNQIAPAWTPPGAAAVPNANAMSDDVNPTHPSAGLDDKTIMELLTTIITVADGKLCVEYEHATATVLKSNMIRDANTATSNREAYTLITTIPAEVIGSMSYYEKCTTILNQISLAIENGDFTQAAILLKKIRLSEITKFTEIKYYYYIMQARIHYNAESWLDACRAYYQLFLQVRQAQDNFDQYQLDFETAVAKHAALPPPAKGKPVPKEPELQKVVSNFYGKTVLSTLYKQDVTELFTTATSNDADRQKAWQPWLQRAIIAGVLAPWDYESEQQLLLIATNDQFVAKTGLYATILTHFNAKQVIYWPITQSTEASFAPQYKFDNEKIDLLSTLQQDQLFIFSKSSTSSSAMSDDAVSDKDDAKWALLRKRVVQHDIRTLSQSFSQLTFKQAADLMVVPIDELELELAALATQFGLKLDRRNQLIDFIAEKDRGMNVLSKWADDLTELFNLVENTEQFIQKVRTINQVASK